MDAIILTFKGEDDWERPVFKGDNGKTYKSIELVGSDAKTILANIYTCDNKFQGEPSSLAKGSFELAAPLPWVQ